LVAIVTPMQAGGALDLRGFAKLLDFHVTSGTSGIVVVGTTGESPTVDVEEHCLLIKTAVELAAGRIPVIAGTGANATAEAIELTRSLAAAGKSDFAVYGGDDITALPLMLMGGHGVISVTANIAPKLMSEMSAAALAGDVARARAANDRLLPLHRKLFVEANPIPVKWALAEMGLINGELRLPLTPLATQHHETVRAALREAGCL